MKKLIFKILKSVYKHYNIFWIARDKNNSLNIFINKPEFDSEFGEWCSDESYNIDEHLFTDITINNSPKKIIMIYD
jgi:hypothetical protein